MKLPFDTELLIRVLKEEASSEEQKRVKNWLNDTEENHLFFQKFSQFWDNLRKETNTRSLDIDNAWLNVEKQIKPVRQLIPWQRLAVSAVLIIGLFIGPWYWWSQSLWVEVITELEQKEVTLPDGSRVWLNYHSELAYKMDFVGERKLKLNGEAYFEVEKNPEKPFSIAMEKGQVKVLGTSFNLSAYTSDSLIDLEVTSGKVAFSSSTEELIIVKNQSATLSKNTGKVNPLKKPDINVLSWKTKWIFFENAGIEEVEQVIFNTYGYQLNIDQNLANRTVNVSFKNQSKEEVMEVIASLLGGKLERKKDIYVIIK